ncbi:PQQ-dependent sugar dehydrogenase [Defluviimonas sp. SAOS-178_SWC]|uniref:PQQ-dependent sugar dehydrogenase n=1 Tax=Defluviimonas sp. SAOS-178_SWC TaxID=3121287 RepID=UPI00322176BE
MTGGVLLFGFVAGISAEFLIEPSAIIRRAALKIAPPPPPEPVTDPDVESIFLTFHRETIQVPITRYGRGGGLTVVDDTAVLATIDGKLFLASAPDDVRPLSIGVPDYGFEAYRDFAKDPANSDYHFELWAYRYFDILAYQMNGGSHLALSFIRFEPERRCFHTIVSVLDIPSTAPELAAFTATADDWHTAYVTEPCLPLKKKESAIEVQIGGGRMAYDGNGRLYLGSGDFHIDGVFSEMPAIAQDPAYDYGKVIEIDLVTGENRQIAQGLRNMQGITFDAEGQLWTVEHGLRGGDELNLIEDGKDYGWPHESLGTLYNRLPIPSTLSYGRHDRFEPPIYAFLPSVAISSLELLHGFNPAWDGDILMGTLKDQSLYRFRIVDRRVMFAERIPIGERIRAARQLDEDRLVLFTDDNELVFLTETPNGQAMSFLSAYLDQPTLDAHVRERLESNLNTCLKCHSLDPDVNDFAPSLATIVGSRIGGTRYASYSDWMRAQETTWTTDRLATFLEAPEVAAPGTTMPDPGIHDPGEIGAVVEFLAAMSSPLNPAAE